VDFYNKLARRHRRFWSVTSRPLHPFQLQPPQFQHACFQLAAERQALRTGAARQRAAGRAFTNDLAHCSLLRRCQSDPAPRGGLNELVASRARLDGALWLASASARQDCASALAAQTVAENWRGVPQPRRRVWLNGNHRWRRGDSPRLRKGLSKNRNSLVETNSRKPSHDFDFELIVQQVY
jgi:hypothetical protein